MSVELSSADHTGGALFEWRLDGGDFCRRYNSLPEWLDTITELLVTGRFERYENDRGPYLRVQDEDAELPLAAPRHVRPHPAHGD